MHVPLAPMLSPVKGLDSSRSLADQPRFPSLIHEQRKLLFSRRKEPFSNGVCFSAPDIFIFIDSQSVY